MLNYLINYVAEIKISASRAMFGEAPQEPGLHCRHCRAKYKCESLQKTDMTILDTSMPNTKHQVMTGNALAFEYMLLNRGIKLLQYRKDALEIQIESELKNGKIMNGLVLEPTYGRKRWSKNLPTERIIKDMAFWDIDIRKPDNIDTPTQVMKKVKSSNLPIEPSDIEQYIEIPKTGYKVIENTESRIVAAFAKFINQKEVQTK